MLVNKNETERRMICGESGPVSPLVLMRTCLLIQGDDAEVAPLREKILEQRRVMFEALQTEVSKRWTFEETVSTHPSTSTYGTFLNISV